MNEDALVETMAREWKRNDSGVAGYPELKARRQLETLRAEGFEVYRPENAIWIECPVCEGGTEVIHERDCDVCADPNRWTEHVEDCPRCGAYGEIRVVPVGEGTDDEL